MKLFKKRHFVSISKYLKREKFGKISLCIIVLLLDFDCFGFCFIFKNGTHN